MILKKICGSMRKPRISQRSKLRASNAAATSVLLKLHSLDLVRLSCSTQLRDARAGVCSILSVTPGRICFRTFENPAAVAAAARRMRLISMSSLIRRTCVNCSRTQEISLSSERIPRNRAPTLTIGRSRRLPSEASNRESDVPTTSVRPSHILSAAVKSGTKETKLFEKGSLWVKRQNPSGPVR